MALAGNDNKDLLIELVEHESEMVFKRLISNFSLPEDARIKILESDISRILLLVESLRYTRMSETFQEKLASHPEVDVRSEVCLQLGDDLCESIKCKLILDSEIPEDSRVALVPWYRSASQDIILALLEGNSEELCLHGCKLLEENGRFFDSLLSLTNWKNGVVPIYIIKNSMQIALANHSDPEVRKQLARCDICDEVQAILEADSNSEVIAELYKGVDYSKMLGRSIKAIESMKKIW